MAKEEEDTRTYVSDETRREVAALKQDIAVLRADLRDLLRSAKSDGQGQIQDAKMRLRNTARNLEHRAQARVHDAMASARETGEDATIYSQGVVAAAPPVLEDFLRLAGDRPWRA